MKDNTSIVISNLVDLLKKGNAHVSLDNALKDIPFDLVNKVPEGLPYNIWQLAEHIRISQWDILEFSRNSTYQSPEWPKGYWPQSLSATEMDWEKCVSKIKEDRRSFIKQIENAGEDIYKPFPYGEGQTLLREALVLADHNAYHTAEIIVVRRILGNWE